ncbi:MAG: ATPase [Bacteroidales bacterium]|nr:ATPase [Bacteroidales bacterium]
MITLIADSGSTKTTWCLVEKTKGAPALVQPVQTQGLNPLYAQEEDIIAAVRQVIVQTGGKCPDQVQFYGAGCSGERSAVVERALRKVFTPMTRIEVASDLLGACRALGTGINCILGTGAIAARYDAATDQMQSASSLGYILGDEGSGAWLGRHVLSDYLKEQMPPRTCSLFEEDFGRLTPESAIEHVYKMPFPNRYLASFAIFVGRHTDNSYCQQLAYRGVESFFKRNVLRLQPQSGETISFVGSVAYGLQDTLRVVAELHDLHIGRIIKSPIEGLI